MIREHFDQLRGIGEFFPGEKWRRARFPDGSPWPVAAYASSEGRFFVPSYVSKAGHRQRPRILGQSEARTGYLHVNVPGVRKRRTVQSHRAVAASFYGPIAPGLVVRHLNDIPKDNRLSNLATGTRAQNWEDYQRNCPVQSQRKYRSEAVLQAYREGRRNVRLLADLFGMSETGIRGILKSGSVGYGRKKAMAIAERVEIAQRMLAENARLSVRELADACSVSTSAAASTLLSVRGRKQHRGRSLDGKVLSKLKDRGLSSREIAESFGVTVRAVNKSIQTFNSKQEETP